MMSENGGAASYFNPKLSLSDEEKRRSVEQILKPLHFSAETVQKLREVFEDELELGSALNPRQPPLFSMDNTFVVELPDGTVYRIQLCDVAKEGIAKCLGRPPLILVQMHRDTLTSNTCFETGDYLGLDLGNTNFRVVLLKLRPGRQADFVVKYYPIDKQLRIGSGEKLFDFMAKCIRDFLEELQMPQERYPLGFTFSYGTRQKSLDSAIVDNWAGIFDSSGVLGNEAVQMLSDAINRRGDLQIDVIAIMNDTTATLVTGAFLNPACAMGVIVGTGCNGAYIDKVQKIEKLLSTGDCFGDEVIINPEFSLLCDKNRTDFIMTEFDYALDKESPHPGFVVFEKIVGGLFLGELIRLILLKLVEKKLLFGGQKSSRLAEKDSIVASDVSAIEGDTCDSVATMEIIRRLGYESFSTDDVTILKYVCAIVSIRFAKLLSVCIACLLERMNKPMVTIAMDGSVYKHHPKLHRLLTQFVGEMVPGKKFQLILAEDGSGKGAALVAAVACRLYKSKKYAQIFKKEHCIE